MVYVNFILAWVLWWGTTDNFTQKPEGYPGGLTKEQASEEAERIIQQVSNYPIEQQQLAFDSLELLVNYFEIDTLRYSTYLKRGRFEFFAKNDIDKALQYFTNAKDIAIRNNDAEREISALLQIAQVYSNTGINEKTTEVLLNLIDRASAIGDSTQLSAAYFQLGLASVSISDYTIRMFKKSLAYSNPGTRNLVSIYANLGQAYLLINPPNLDSAQYYLEIGNRINDTARVSPGAPLNLVEAYILQGYYARADSLVDQVLHEPIYGNYDFSLLAYDLKIRILQQREEYRLAYPYVLEGLDKILVGTVFDDYEVVDFSHTAKESLYALNDLENYRKLDSIERAANDSIMVYIENAQVSRLESARAVDELEGQIALKDDKIRYRNVALAIGGLLLLLGLVAGYQTVRKGKLRAQLYSENQRAEKIEQEKEVSDQYVTKLEQEMAEKIQQQERQLLSYMASLSHKNATLQNVLTLLEEVKNQPECNGKVDTASTMLAEVLEDEVSGKKFFKHFENVHPQFYQKLDERSANLTKQDKRVLAYIKMRLTSKEIAQLLGVNYESVNTSRYRLRKKLHLTKEEDLDEFIEKV